MSNIEKIPTKGRFDDDEERAGKKEKNKKKRKSRKDAHLEEKHLKGGFNDEPVIPDVDISESSKAETQEPVAGGDTFVERSEELQKDMSEFLEAYAIDQEKEDDIEDETHNAEDTTKASYVDDLPGMKETLRFFLKESEEGLPELRKAGEKSNDIEVQDKEKLFNKFGLSSEDLNSIEGFKELSDGQKFLIFENLKQISLGRIQAGALSQHQEEIGKAKVCSRIWQGITKRYQIAKNEKEKLADIENGGLELHEEVLQQLVNGMKEANIEVEIKDNKPEIQYASGFENINEEEQEVIRSFNKIATEYSKTPYEWSLPTASSKEQKKFKNVQEKYRVASAEIFDLKYKILQEQEGRNVNDTNYLNNHEAQIFGYQIDKNVQLNQFLNTNPEVEKELQGIENKPAWQKILKDVITERGIYATAGFLTRTASVSLLGSMGGLIGAGTVLGAVFAGKRAEKGLEEKERLARGGASDEGKEMYDFVNVGKLTEKLNYLIEDFEKYNNSTEEVTADDEEKRYSSLIARIDYTEDKVKNGLVNFGEDKKRVAEQYELMKALSRAKVLIFPGVPGADRHNKMMGRLNNFLGKKYDAVVDEQREYKKEQMLRGAMLGATFAFLGSAIRETGAEILDSPMDDAKNIQPKPEDLLSKKPNVLLNQADVLVEQEKFSEAVSHFLAAANKLDVGAAKEVLDQRIEKIVAEHPELENEFRAEIIALKDRLDPREVPEVEVVDPTSAEPALTTEALAQKDVQERQSQGDDPTPVSRNADSSTEQSSISAANTSSEVVAPSQEQPQYPTTEINREWIKGENEKLLHFGGEQRTGFDKDENIVYDVSKMEGVGEKGNLRMLITLSGDNQGEVIEMPVNAEGKIIFNKDKDSELVQKLFTEEDGQLVFKGKQLEIAQVDGEAGDGPQDVKILATSVGKNELTESDIQELSKIKPEVAEAPASATPVVTPKINPDAAEALSRGSSESSTLEASEVQESPQAEVPVIENEVEISSGHELKFNEHLVKTSGQYSLIGVDGKGDQFNIFSFDPKLEEANVIRAAETHNTELATAVVGKNIDPIQYMRKADLDFRPGNNAENIERLQALVQNDIPVDKAQEVISLADSARVPLETTAKHFGLVENKVYTPEQRQSILQLIQDPSNTEAKNRLLEGYPKLEEVTVKLTGEDVGVEKLYLHYKEEDMDVFLYGDQIFATQNKRIVNNIKYSILEEGGLTTYLRDPRNFRGEAGAVDI